MRQRRSSFVNEMKIFDGVARDVFQREKTLVVLTKARVKPFIIRRHENLLQRGQGASLMEVSCVDC